MPSKRSFSRLDPFVRGQIVGMRAAGAKREDIAKTVKKKDGRSPTIRAVDAVLAKHAGDPQWHALCGNMGVCALLSAMAAAQPC